MPVQEVRRHRRLRHRARRDATPTSWSTSIAALEPTFGGINLEDIKAPECFDIESKLRERMKIPVFHDDQHGTAIISAAALLNGAEGRRQGRSARSSWSARAPAPRRSPASTCSSSWACERENIWVRQQGRGLRGPRRARWTNKARYAQETDARTLGDVIDGADMFLGLSAAGVLKPDMVRDDGADGRSSSRWPIPTRRSCRKMAKAVRAGLHHRHRPLRLSRTRSTTSSASRSSSAARSTVGATTINEEMKLACVRAHRRAGAGRAVRTSWPRPTAAGHSAFGPDYLIPKPFDPRLITKIAPAVARRRCESGVATRPIEDLDAYRERCSASSTTPARS